MQSEHLPPCPLCFHAARVGAQVEDGSSGQPAREQVPPHGEWAPSPFSFSQLSAPLFCFQFEEVLGPCSTPGEGAASHGRSEESGQSPGLWTGQGTLSVGFRPVAGMAQEWL